MSSMKWLGDDLASGETPEALLGGELQRYDLSVTERGSRGKPGARAVAERLAAVVQSMKDAGVWETPRPPESAFENMGAFGMNTMPFTDWLRWVFVPNVERLIASEGPWPRSSQVSVQAAREGDTDDVVRLLVPALAAFDDLFA